MVDQIFQKPKPILGTVELLPLPGSAGWQGKIGDVVARAEQEATTLATGGVDGLILENTNDHPYRHNGLDPAAIVAMATLAQRICRFTQLPMGLSVLLNNPETALAIAQSVPVDFIRVPILAGSLISDAGQLESKLRELLEYRNILRLKSLPPLWVDISLNHRVPDLNEAAAHQRYPLLERLVRVAETADKTGLVSAFVLRDSDVAPLAPDLSNALEVLGERLPHPVIIANTTLAPDALSPLYREADALILSHGIRKPGISPAPVDLSQVEERIATLQQGLKRASV